MEMDHVKDMRLKGMAKHIHRLFMLLTYPIRHIFKFLVFSFIACVFLAAIPMSQGVSYRHVIDWYLLRYTDTKDKLNSEIRVFEVKRPESESVSRFKEVSAPKIIRKKSQHNNVEARKRVFKKPPVILPQEMKQKQENSEIKTVSEEPQEAIIPVKESKANPASSYYRKVETLDLVYEEMPKQITDTAIVFNANELAVGDAYIILYGIYSPTDGVIADKAFRYLKELVEGRELTCQIVAYTKENIPTAVCFSEGRSINQNMIDAGFAQNIAL